MKYVQAHFDVNDLFPDYDVGRLRAEAILSSHLTDIGITDFYISKGYGGAECPVAIIESSESLLLAKLTYGGE